MQMLVWPALQYIQSVLFQIMTEYCLPIIIIKCSNICSRICMRKYMKIYAKINSKNYTKMKEQISNWSLTFIILNLKSMASRIDQEESEFKIQESLRKKKSGAPYKAQHYSVVTYQMRVKLINLASSKGYSISRAARELGIKPSTGKFIVKCFRDHGKIMKKTTSRIPKLTLSSQELSNGDSGADKQQKLDKSSSSTKFLENKVEHKIVQNMSPIVSQDGFSQMFVFGYPYQQTVASPLIICPNIQYTNSILMPVFIPQTF